MTMNIEKTIKFASKFNQVLVYFDELTPKKEVLHIYEDKDDFGLTERYGELVTESDLDKEVLSIQPSPVAYEEFADLYNEFLMEFDVYVLQHSEGLIRGVLKSKFGYRGESPIHPTYEQLFRAEMYPEAHLLEIFSKAYSFIHWKSVGNSGLVSSGIQDYKDQLKESRLNSDLEPEGGLLNNEDVEGFMGLLSCNENEKESLIKKLRFLTKERRTKELTDILIALCQLGHIQLLERGKKKIYKSFHCTFNLSNSLESFERGVNGNLGSYTNGWIRDANHQRDVDQMKRLLTSKE